MIESAFDGFMEQRQEDQAGRSRGRWTEAEHESFLLGLHLYGREWKKVAATIKTRTSAQIRSHAQKYFAKLAKDDALSDASSDDTDSSSLETKKKRQIDSHDDILAAIASPSVRRRVETLLDDEVCALQVLASYKHHVMDE
ncbi:hypothetical protein LEN26_007998 [Aphanomyces euteiches]|nr:hypothetical protein AeMF1_010347 [Aphanomyces euteiches]KAH9131016.1 hypothetical protein LEN26_007998 [Aphanomyces euteiches]KAH9191712.1 hypothetical protein AeNC1_006307 [Aphanomyces euteiches]